MIGYPSGNNSYIPSDVSSEDLIIGWTNTNSGLVETKTEIIDGKNVRVSRLCSTGEIVEHPNTFKIANYKKYDPDKP